jgi:hypothetical protein
MSEAAEQDDFFDGEYAPPQFSLAWLIEIKTLLGLLLAVPIFGRAMFLVIAGMLLLILLQLPFFWLSGAFRTMEQGEN